MTTTIDLGSGDNIMEAHWRGHTIQIDYYAFLFELSQTLRPSASAGEQNLASVRAIRSLMSVTPTPSEDIPDHVLFAFGELIVAAGKSLGK